MATTCLGSELSTLLTPNVEGAEALWFRLPPAPPPGTQASDESRVSGLTRRLLNSVPRVVGSFAGSELPG